MERSISLLFTFILFKILAVSSANLQCENVTVCAQGKYSNCEECIRAHHCCSWCSDINFNTTRCDTTENLKASNCLKKLIFDGGQSIVKSQTMQSFSNANEAEGKPAVQIIPQEIDVALRLRHPVKFQLKYKAAENYPLDLYYLMDLTLSMAPDLEAMISLGSSIGKHLEDLTKEYKIAFGYYSDKVASPFAMMDDKSSANPCSSLQSSCAKAFDFVHSLNFTDKVNDFTEKLKQSKVTANSDNLEGGIDAIMQIIACQKYMQWRKFSRKIVVVATGGLMHFAGDGLLSGSVKKNPGTCMLDENGAYNSLVYDYPSLGEIYRKLQEEKINLLFAAKEEAFDYYNDLHNTIPEVSTVGKLEMQSKNIQELIKSSYEKVVQNVKFEANVTDNVKITFETVCKGKDSNKKERSQCKNVKIGQEYIFDVTLELIELPKDGKVTDTFIIEEMNLFEFTKINVEYIGVKCNCLESGTVSRDCSNGTFRCGVCHCNEGWTGQDCSIECRENVCRFSNSTYTSSTCYGRYKLGRKECDCDMSSCSCQCDSRYTGTFCEYPQCRKNRRTGEVCSGKGICDRGTCECSENYSGDDCSCYTQNDTCFAPGQNKLCNGAGTCICGQCQCQEGYSGKFCEYCPDCDAICSSFEQCVVGVSLNNTLDNCVRNGTKYETTKNNLAEDMCLARYINENGETCDVKYSYAYDIRKVMLEYRHPDCSKPLSATTTGLLAFSLIVAIGLLLIIVIKVKHSIEDKRELAKHDREVLLFMNRREENPLYLSPITQHVNPLRELEEEKKDL